MVLQSDIFYKEKLDIEAIAVVNRGIFSDGHVPEVKDLIMIDLVKLREMVVQKCTD